MPAPVLKLLSAALAESDADLLGRFVATRDEPAFAELVRRHGPAVYRVCRRLAGPSAADDAFQATFLVLACRAGAVRKAASVGSWLIGVAGRVSRQMRARARRAGGVSPLMDVPDQGAHAPRSPELVELSHVLDDELSRLPAALRDPVALCLIGGRTQEQAAALLGGSVRTVRRRLERAKAVLRARLERRGVVPAVAAGLVAGVGGPSAAVPPDLARRTVAGVHTFLTGGGASTPAAVAAKGVVGGMVKLKVSAAMATLAAAVIGLGVGLAYDGPKPAPAAKADPPQKVAEPPAKPPVDPGVATSAEHKTANFVVHADHPAHARALANELEFQRREQAEAWLGKELPPWPEPCRVRIEQYVGLPGLNGGVALRLSPRLELIWGLTGDLEHHLRVGIPHHAALMVLATAVGAELPYWVEKGLVGRVRPGANPEYLRWGCAKYLRGGQAYRLENLFPGPPLNTPEESVCAAQGSAVSEFLLTRGDKPTLVRFVAVGVKDGWNKAAKDVYGFADVGALETAWITWMKDNPPPQPKEAPKPADPDRIPPVKLADPKPAAEDAPGGFRKTDNFTVMAPTVELAYMVGGEAERLRKLLAERWLGKELPAWPQPLPITVKVTQGSPGGASTFTFGDKGVTSAEMELHGPVREVLNGQLPHELMHAVLAHHFGRPVPRWADEGIALTAEPEAEQHSHDVKAREYVNAGRAIRLRTLLPLTQYPKDMHVLYAQGHSVVRFLLARPPRPEPVVVPSDPPGREIIQARERQPRAALLEFVRLGSAGNTANSWEHAANAVYGFGSVDELEQAWLDWLRGGPEPAAKPGEPDLIPPARLPEPGRKPAPAEVPAAAGPDGVYRLASRTFKLPVRLTDDRRGSARRVELHVSADRGATWAKAAEVAPDATGFRYEAPADGAYWFRAVVVAADGTRQPGDLTAGDPDLKVVVDTSPGRLPPAGLPEPGRKPAARRPADQVRVHAIAARSFALPIRRTEFTPDGLRGWAIYASADRGENWAQAA